ncbi:unnamed protein product [Kuraishia capsulata CBS 1993]|uniref:Rho-GAP domain-containing protein n=1 Tax=Kuraishia capsulata CBS 1993 TaxID=1382522 RepID=W6MHD3_9ASCO|nr:uncharacterized protein KUCA_T00001604001 [Kuraishia capsulata CBS 1993]CDK25634.1 unnamed protein product [Kuraishia capsulata CBS 1993]
MKKIWARKDKARPLDETSDLGNGEVSDAAQYRSLHRLSSTRSLASFVRSDNSRRRLDQPFKLLNGDLEDDNVSLIQEKDEDKDLGSLDQRTKGTSLGGTTLSSNTNTPNPKFYKSSSFSSSSSHLANSLKRNKASTEKLADQSEISRGSLNSLVQPQWDGDLIKVGWLNRSSSGNDENGDNMRLCRAEVRGSFLSVYKPPPELASIKALKLSRAGDQDSENGLKGKESSERKDNNASERSVVEDSEPLLNHAVSSDSLSVDGSSLTTLNMQSRSNRSPSTNKSVSISLNSEASSVFLTYFSSGFPHPDVTFDSRTGTILNSTLEGLCHSILFNTYESESEDGDADLLSKNLLGILPLFDDILLAIKYFVVYSDTFTKSKPRDDNRTLMDEDVRQVITSTENAAILARRLMLVVTYIRDTFSGALLEDAIFKAIWDLMLSIDSHQNSDELKKSIHRKQQQLLRLSDGPLTESVNAFSGDYFMGCDPVLMAHSIRSIHLEYRNTWSPQSDPSLLMESNNENHPYHRKNPLVFSFDKDIHYVSELLTQHLFVDVVYSKSAAKRAKILTRWIEVASALDSIGDMVGWLAIATAVCSLPVLRLKETWALVDANIIDDLSANWSPVVSELDRRSLINAHSHRSTYHVIVPQGMGTSYPKESVIPHFGDLLIKKASPVSVQQCEKRRRRLDVSFQKWEEYWASISNSEPLRVIIEPESPAIVKQLKAMLKLHSSKEPSNIERVMTLSLQVEPSFAGQFHEFHNTSRSPLFLGSYASVIFPSPLDKYQIYDQSALIGAIGGNENSKSIAVYDNSLSNQSNVVKSDENKDVLAPAAGYLGRTQFLKSIRDLFNIGSSDFHVGDEIVFKTMSDAEALNDLQDNEKENERENLRSGTTHVRGLEGVDGTSKRDSLSTMRSRSRPSSILFTESINTKRFSSYSSSGLNLDDIGMLNLTSSKRQAEPHSVEILTKSATLDRLIDLLVLTSSIFAAEIKKDDVIPYLSSDVVSNVVNLRMDNGVYTVTFFATYRGFCSTSSLLKGLMARFVGAQSAAQSISLRKSISGAFKMSGYPQWQSKRDAKSDVIIQKYTLQIRIGVLEALLILVRDHFDHFASDLEAKRIFTEVLRIIDHEAVLSSRNFLDQSGGKSEDSVQVELYHEKILLLYKKLRRSYIRQSYKPLLPSVAIPQFPESSSIVPLDALLSDNSSKIKGFISSIDSIIHEVFIQASTNDWLDTFDALEMQATYSLTGLSQYQMQKLKVPEDELAISNVFSWISSLVAIKGADRVKVLNVLPSSVRSIIDLYSKLKTYFSLQLCDPNITRDERVKRMRAALLMLTVTRSRMKVLDLFDPEDAQEIGVSPHVPSLLESVIVNTIISPESRLFAHSWVAAAESFNGGEYLTAVGSLQDLLPAEIPTEFTSGSTLTACPGWLLERLVEIAYYIPNMSVENTNLINFDKRRFAYNCVSNIVDMVALQNRDYSDDTVDFSFVFGLNPEGYGKKLLVEAASRESKEYIKEGAYKYIRLFGTLLDEELKILSREHAKKVFLSKQEVEKDRLGRQMSTYRPVRPAKVTPQISSSTTLASTLRKKSTVSTPTNNKFRFSGLISRAAKPFTFGSTNPEQVVTIDELPDAADFSDIKQKPFLHVCLKNHLVFPVYHIPSSFKITSANSDITYLFQAIDEKDREDWITKSSYSAKHWFFSKALVAHAPPTQVFGVPLEYICVREGSLVPLVLEKLMTEIEMRGLEEVGIYRKSASLTVLNSIKAEIDAHGDLSMENHLVLDINNAAACIKVFLRELPDPLVPDELVVRFAEARKRISDVDEKCFSYTRILESLPFHNYQFLKRLISHLRKVDEYKEFSKMNASNLATILGATFTEGSGPDITRQYFGVMSFVCEDMINHYEAIFKV